MTRWLALCLPLLLGACSHLLDLGSSEPIQSDPGVRTLGDAIDDERIETTALVNLRKLSESLRQAHLVVVSYNGYVLLAGQVTDAASKQQAETLVQRIRGVRRVHNALALQGPSSYLTRTADSWISAKVKSRLLVNADIEGGRIKVVTENGAVYLMGLVNQAEAQRAVEIAGATYGVQQVVKLFEYVERTI